MKEWKVILAALVLFGTGVVTGGFLVHLTSGKQPRVKPAFAFNPMPKEFRGPVHEQRFDYIRRLTQQLELAPEQAGKIEKILQASQQRSKAAWDTIQPKLSDEVRKTREQIHEVLSSEQRKKYDDINKQQRPRKDGRPDSSGKVGQRTKTPGPAPVSTNLPQPSPPPAPDTSK